MSIPGKITPRKRNGFVIWSLSGRRQSVAAAISMENMSCPPLMSGIPKFLITSYRQAGSGPEGIGTPRLEDPFERSVWDLQYSG